MGSSHPRYLIVEPKSLQWRCFSNRCTSDHFGPICRSTMFSLFGVKAKRPQNLGRWMLQIAPGYYGCLFYVLCQEFRDLYCQRTKLITASPLERIAGMTNQALLGGALQDTNTTSYRKLCDASQCFPTNLVKSSQNLKGSNWPSAESGKPVLKLQN